MPKIRVYGVTENNAPTDVDYSGMSICSTCCEIKGPWRYLDDGSGGHRQKCDCDRKSGTRARTWPGFDFNTTIESCYCCGLELLSSGSRWALWFCGDCVTNVVGFNNQHQAYLIPIGRHSLHAGAGLTIDEITDKAKVDEFARGWAGTVGGIKALSMWAHQIVASNLDAFGFDRRNDTPLSDYLAAIARQPVDKHRAFTQLCEFIGGLS